MEEATKYLFNQDSVFEQIYNQYGNPPIITRPQGFQSLAKLILEQQVSLESAKACFQKLEDFLGAVTPQTISSTTLEDLRNNGVSRQKASYLHSLSKVILNNTLNLENLNTFTEEKIKIELTKVKGIGDWTSDVYAMFCLDKTDVFPIGDIALQNTLKEFYKVETKQQMIQLSEKWKPYRSHATRFFWHYYLSKRNRKPLEY